MDHVMFHGACDLARPTSEQGLMTAQCLVPGGNLWRGFRAGVDAAVPALQLRHLLQPMVRNSREECKLPRAHIACQLWAC